LTNLLQIYYYNGDLECPYPRASTNSSIEKKGCTRGINEHREGGQQYKRVEEKLEKNPTKWNKSKSLKNQKDNTMKSKA